MKGVASVGSESEQDLLEKMLDEYAPPPPCKYGDIVEGVIVSAEPKSMIVDIGYKSDAIVLPNEVEQMTPEELRSFRPGQVVYVYVLDSGDKDNVLLVSLAKAAQKGDWNNARKLMEDAERVELEVVDINKGGVIVSLGQLRGFVPSSQLMPNWHSQQNVRNPERRWEALTGKTLALKIIEVTPSRNRLILSERSACIEKPDKHTVLKSLEVGSVHKGTVSNVVDFGAFVNVKGVDGLLHISELSWERVNHPTEIVQAGQELDIYILDVDLERERLSLSLKRLKPDPWEKVTELYQEGQLVEVQIVNLTSFGAFACPLDLPEIEGLIHISELCDHTISRPEEIVQVGSQRTARIISLRPKDRRIAFSLKQAAEEESGEEIEQPSLETVQEEASKEHDA